MHTFLSNYLVTILSVTTMLKYLQGSFVKIKTKTSILDAFSKKGLYYFLYTTRFGKMKNHCVVHVSDNDYAENHNVVLW